jgi:hypothetical protein
MPEIDNEAQKQIIKQAITEWLDKQFAILGKWTLAGFASASIAALAYFIFTTQGWHK